MNDASLNARQVAFVPAFRQLSSPSFIGANETLALRFLIFDD